MIISVSPSGVELTDADNFKAFKVAVTDPAVTSETLADRLKGVAVVDDSGHAWIDEAALRSMGEKVGSAGWQDNATGMIAYANKSGWVCQNTGAIRAHVEWPAKA